MLAGFKTSGGEGGIRIRAETYIQQDAEQPTAVFAILVHASQWERQVNGRWHPKPLPCQFWGRDPKTLSPSSFSALDWAENTVQIAEF